MKISYIITINPVIEIDYLNILIHSLNLQTAKEFNVIFYNQTLMTETSLFSALKTTPSFEYSFYSVEHEHFFGSYPIWDLYGFHQFLLDNGLLSDYFMSLHMEEFLEPDYTKEILSVLAEGKYAVLLGNLHSTPYDYSQMNGIIHQETVQDFNTFLQNKKFHKSLKWGLNSKPFFLTRTPGYNFKKEMILKFKKQLKPTRDGATRLNRYLFEDIFAMSTEFAHRYHWYQTEVALYFEDIHINSSLEALVKKITPFPVYFNRSKIFHLAHGKYYYQIEDDEFTEQFLCYPTLNPILQVLKEAITAYKDGSMTVKEALRLSRQKGTVEYNFQFHKTKILNDLSR